MASILALTNAHPVRRFAAGHLLIEAGEAGGDLYVLQEGRLVVEREGIEIAEISEPGSLIGEMSVLLGVDHSATVRATTAVEVRVIDNAIRFLETSPLLALHVATLACARLDATSKLLAELRREMAGKAGEQGFLNRIFGAVSGSPAPRPRG